MVGVQSSTLLPMQSRLRFLPARAIVAFATLLGLVSCSNEAPRAWILRSPDGRIELRVTQDNRLGEKDYPDAVALYYEVRRDGRVVLEPSPLGIDTDRTSFRDDLVAVGDERVDVDTTYTMLVGKRHVRTVHGRERTLRFRAQGGDEMELVLRAHDDGVAFRYRVLGTGPVTVQREHSGFAVPTGHRGFLAPFDLAGLLPGTYEHPYVEQDVSEPAALSSGFVYPALFELGAEHVMITESDPSAAYCVTRLDGDPVDGVYRVRMPEPFESLGIGAALPSSTLPLETPFRVVMIGSPEALVESTLVDDLAKPAVVTDTTWIHPGRAAWSWPTQGTGEPALATSYATFAHDMGWEYVLIDAGWDTWANVNTAMPAFVSSAGAQNVRVLLWYNSGGPTSPDPGTPRDIMNDPVLREAEMAKLEAWGVAGIKVDFFQSDKQERVQAYLGILEDAARHHLVVNFHGATLPRGWARTYPNLLTTEAVRGGEYYATGASVVPSPSSLVLDVFMRNVVGSMDFTPVLFDAAHDVGGVGFGASLAQAAAFESGIQHFADRADGSTSAGYGEVFAAHPFVREYLAAVPTTWDETQLLDGAPRTHAVIARRNGTTWWVAGFDGDAGARDFAIPTEFLGAGSFSCRVATGGADGVSLGETMNTLTSSSTWMVSTAAGDGFLAWCTPTP